MGDFSNHGRVDNFLAVGVAELGGEQHEHRANAFASRVNQVSGGVFGNRIGVGGRFHKAGFNQLKTLLKLFDER